jgi:hypothetical protein
VKEVIEHFHGERHVKRAAQDNRREEQTMRTNLIMKRMLIAGALVSISWSPVLTLHADDSSLSVIPEIMGEQPLRQQAVQMIEAPPAQAVWINELRHSWKPSDGLSNLSQTGTPFQAYGIWAPTLGSGQQAAQGLGSGSSQ